MNLQDAYPGTPVSVLMPGIDARTGRQVWLPGEVLYINHEQSTLHIKMLTGTVEQIILGCDTGCHVLRVMRTRRN